MTLDLDEKLGSVQLEPSGSVRAGHVGTWRLVFTVGGYGVDEGGTIKIAQRFASDWETPQFVDPSGPGYTTVVTDGEARVSARYDPKAHERPWMKCIVIDVFDGSLSPGDQVVITLGDSAGGSAGIRAQTFQESAHEFRVLVDPTNASLVRRIPTSPSFPILPGDPVRIVCVVPTTVECGSPVEFHVRGEDEWGNPTEAPAGCEITWDGPGRGTVDGHWLTVHDPGAGRLVVGWKAQTFYSNPTSVTADVPTLRHFWGDLHAQSDATVGTGDEVEYFTFGRDAAFLDFTSHQGNDFQMTDADWRRLNDVVASFNEEGRFVVFPGYEWSANSPAGGDRNVFYLEEGQPIIRSSHWQIPEVPSDASTPAHPVDELFRSVRAHVDLDKVMLASHVGGRYADIRKPEFFDEELGPLVEVASCWGVFEWLLWDAFDAGYVVGIMCNSDGHKGRPGAEGPGAGQFGIGGGLTCVLAEGLTRRSVFGALRERRCYGTTGPRIALWFSGNGAPMGSRVDTNAPITLRARCIGTGPVEALQLFRGRELHSESVPAAFTGLGHSKRIRLSWGGSRIRGRGRRVTWDGSIRVEGNHITRAATFAFDSPADGILEQDAGRIRFRSRTTGDRDGIDVWVRDARSGSVTLDSPVGEIRVDLASLEDEAVRRTFPGLDVHAEIRRYPESPSDRDVSLEVSVPPLDDAVTPYFVRVVQVDGHMAWASPIYIRRVEVGGEPA